MWQSFFYWEIVKTEVGGGGWGERNQSRAHASRNQFNLGGGSEHEE